MAAPAVTAAARRPPLIDISEVVRMLAGRCETLCRELLPRGVKVGAEWCVGSPAGEPGTQMAVHLYGPKAGVWKHFAGTEGGDALDLVAAVLYRGDKSQALAWSKRWLGIDSRDPRALETARRAMPDPEEQRRQARQAAEDGIANARRIWLQGATPQIKDTPVDWYLQGRGIDLSDLGKQPGAIRYHPRLWNKESERHWPAMVAAVTGPSGETTAVHRTWLDVSARQAVKAPLKNPKMTLGPWQGGHIPLWRGANKKRLRDAPEGAQVDITEGIEDGLSVAVTLPERLIVAAISVSNMGAIVLPPSITAVCLWRQNDTHPAPIAAFEQAKLRHNGAGREVIIPAIPPEVKDVNDLLRADANG